MYAFITLYEISWLKKNRHLSVYNTVCYKIFYICRDRHTPTIPANIKNPLWANRILYHIYESKAIVRDRPAQVNNQKHILVNVDLNWHCSYSLIVEIATDFLRQGGLSSVAYTCSNNSNLVFIHIHAIWLLEGKVHISMNVRAGICRIYLPSTVSKDWLFWQHL